MLQEDPNLQDIIKDLSRAVTTQFASDEIDLFDELYAQFQQDPTKFKQRLSSNDPLEFGLDELLSAYTPIIISMVTITLNKLSEMIIQALKGETEDFVQEKTKKVFQRVLKGKNNEPYQSEFMTFSTQELEALYKLGIQEGITYGLPPNEAAKIMQRLTQPIMRVQQK